LERMARKSSGVWNRVLFALGQSTSQRAVQTLMEQMPEHFDQVASLLSRMGDGGRTHIFRIATDEAQTALSRQTVAEALADSPGIFQEEGRQIAEIVGQRRVETPINDLVALLQHPSCAKRRAAVESLSRLGAEGAADDIARLSDDEHWQVRASVARVLARWGKPEATLDRLRRDSDIIVRGYARWHR